MIPLNQIRISLAVFLFGSLLSSGFAQQAEPQEVSDPKGAIIMPIICMLFGLIIEKNFMIICTAKEFSSRFITSHYIISLIM